MNLRLTLQHGIGLQQLFLDLIHLLALPTHRRHVWHHQLTGLWSRATRVSVGGGTRAVCPSLSLHPTLPESACLLPCVRAGSTRLGLFLFSPMVTIIASYYHHRSHFQCVNVLKTWVRDDASSQTCYVSTGWLHEAWGMFFKIIPWIIKKAQKWPAL